jgi:hypothetical protein
MRVAHSSTLGWKVNIGYFTGGGRDAGSHVRSAADGLMLSGIAPAIGGILLYAGFRARK